MSDAVTVLKSWSEVGQAIHSLAERGYRLHHNPVKSWDLWLISEMVKDLNREELVVDLGAAVLGGVRLLHEMGFRKIIGYDFEFSIFDRMLQLRDWLAHMRRARRPTALPYRLHQRDLLMTGVPAGRVGAIVCLSVVEHGVDLGRFFGEMARLLKPAGRLYVSTDYWDPKLDRDGRKMFGQPWTIFCAKEIKSMIEYAKRFGLIVERWEPENLKCQEAVVHDGPHAYTFAAIRFRKEQV